MTRRIALTVLALITVLLVLAVVPLGVLLTERERTSFRSDAEASARAIASAAEEHLSDQKSDASMLHLLAEAQDEGGCSAVYDTAAQVIARTSCTGATGDAAARLVGGALAHPQTRTAQADDRLTVVTPVGDAEDPVGAAVLVRSADPLNDRITIVWGWLAGIGVVGLLAGTLVSVRLARWVGSPLHAVDQAAQRLGEGALDVRAPAERGPEEVRRLAATFNTMAARTEALVHGHRTVIADVSHQLRTPLAALRLRLDLLARDSRRRSPGCPGWSTDCSPWRARRARCPDRSRCGWTRWSRNGSRSGNRWQPNGRSRSPRGAGRGSAPFSAPVTWSRSSTICSPTPWTPSRVGAMYASRGRRQRARCTFG